MTFTLFPNLPLSKGAIWLLLRSHRIFMIPRRAFYHLKQTHRQQALAELQASSIGCRHFHPTMAATDPRASLKPAARVAGRKLDVWYVLMLNVLSVFPIILPCVKVVEHELRKWESQQTLTESLFASYKMPLKCILSDAYLGLSSMKLLRIPQSNLL